MGLLDKVTKTAVSISKTAINTATAAGASVGVTAQDQMELAELKMQLKVVEEELNSSYVQIGRRYVDYIIAAGEMPGVDISDVLKLMDPKLEKKETLEQEIVSLEKKIRNNAILREKQAAEEEFLSEKNKLDKALAMEILSQEEYDVKVYTASKKLENFEMIRKIEQQYDMKLISKDERDNRIKLLTE